MYTKVLLKYKVIYKSLVLFLLTWIWSVRVFHQQALTNITLHSSSGKVLPRLKANCPIYWLSLWGILDVSLLNYQWSFYLMISAWEPVHSSVLTCSTSFTHSNHSLTDSLPYTDIKYYIIHSNICALKHSRTTQANIHKEANIHRDFLLVPSELSQNFIVG